jgi:hypothetical protein
LCPNLSAIKPETNPPIAEVKKVMHEFKEGKLKNGRSGKKVKSRKQAIAIGLSEARRTGAKVPRKRK